MLKRILVADDDAKIVSLLQLRLEQNGYSVLTAKDGEEALEKTRIHKPDLLLLDVSMPKIDGDQVYMALHSDPQTQKIPILMMTGLRSDEEIEASREEGIVAKPVNFDKLMTKIKTYLVR